MKLGKLVVASSLITANAFAGGLFLPGSGATSTSRAGAAVASADDGEALSINPAGLAKTHKGITITLSTTFIRYFMEFTRRGNYDATSDFDSTYEGTPYPTIENDPKPPLGIGKFQPIPVIAVVTDLGGRLGDARLAVGLYAPQGYPFRDMTGGYKFPTAAEPGDLNIPPPPSRYDILTQESRLLLPTIALATRLTDKLDIGARFTAGSVQSKSVVAVWGTPFNVEESVRNDSLFTADVKDGFIPGFGIGFNFRPSPKLEIGFNYSSSLTVKAKGTASSVKGPGVSAERVIGPVPDADASCATGGTFEAQKACVSLELPRTATLGARYKFLDKHFREKADVELNVAWENWGKTCDVDPATGQFKDLECTSPGQYRVVIDSGLYINGNYAQPLEKNYNNYGLQDTYSFRLGGSYRFLLSEPTIDPYSPNSGPPHDPSPPRGKELILRGGVAYDTAAAKTGWLRSALDGAARLTTTLGAAYRTRRFEINLGGGFVYEGENTNPGAKADGSDCNPTLAAGSLGCGTNGQDRPLEERQGPDPTNPLLQPPFQAENPYNQGTYKSHYILMMLGFSTWF